MAYYQITTPEQIQFRFEIAGLVSRVTAWVTDQLILMTVLIAAAMTLSCAGGALGIVLVIIAKFLLDFGYFTYFEQRWRGQTPGKRMMRIRVIASDGGKLRFADVLTRTLFRVVYNLGLAPLTVIAGALVAVVDPYHRRLGDLAADTIVVRDERAALPRALNRQLSRDNSFQSNGALRGRIQARVTREERDLIFDLMVRRDGLSPGVRESLFKSAADYFRERYSLPEDMEHLSDEQTVMNLAMVIQDTRFAG